MATKDSDTMALPELRVLVREVLREALAGRAATAVSGTALRDVETVSIATDGDLQALLRRLSAPGALAAVQSGTLQVRLASPTAARPASGSALLGVVSEAKLAGYAPGSTLVLGPTAVLTPLGRDRARTLGLKIERSDA